MEENIQKVYIAGAHSRGRTFCAYLRYLYPAVEVAAFLVDDMLENLPSVDGVPVRLIEKGLNVDFPVYIATRSVNQTRIREELKAAGMKRIVPVTAELDRKLRNDYLQKYFMSSGRHFLLIDDFGIGDSGYAKQDG